MSLHKFVSNTYEDMLLAKKGYKLMKYDKTHQREYALQDSTKRLFLELPSHSRMASKIKHNRKHIGIHVQWVHR